jgi:nucleoside-diphosphate-sugar epimerase
VDFITELLEKPAAGEPGVINNGDDVPDWLYAEDVARAIILASEAPPCAEAGLTICGEARPMQEAVAYVRQLLPQSDIQVSPGRQSGHMRYDPSTTEAVIGYSPQFSMEAGFRRTINMVRAKRGLPAV